METHSLQYVRSALQNFIKGTTTPLASIFGSGFLVIVSVLAGAVGPYALFAMIGICILAYAVGEVIRFNIIRAEPLLETGKASPLTRLFEGIADIILVPAYIISVTLYLRILSSYGLGFLKLTSEYNERCLTTGILAFILFIGLSKGLKTLEGLEKWALYTTLLIIVVLIGAFGVYDLREMAQSSLVFPEFPKKNVWEIITVLAGMLIVVQGFETPRYLADEYDMRTRVNASRNSQIISTFIYLLFIALATPLMHFLSDQVTDNALINLAGIVALWLPVPLVLAAIFSQFSAATADIIAASGNLLEFTRHKIKEKITYIFICSFAILLVWTADTLQILALASRAFAFYYMMQTLVAIGVSRKSSQKVIFFIIGCILLFIAVFAVPAG